MISSQPPVGGVIGGGGGDLSMFGGGGGSGLGGMDLFSLTTPTTGAYVAPKEVQSFTIMCTEPYDLWFILRFGWIPLVVKD